jgi:hypothetical protein
MVSLATKWLREYFSDKQARRPGDLEDDFAGQWSFNQRAWRATPFYPALALLVDHGEVVFEVDSEGIVWYAMQGALPSALANVESADGAR